MAKTESDSKPEPKYIKYSLLLLIAVGAVLVGLRFVDLGADSPKHFSGHGQAQLTDPYHLTHAARNAELFGDANPYDDHRWDIFKFSLVSGFARLVFAVAGVSSITANVAGVLLMLGGVLLLLLGLYKQYDRIALLLTALVLLANNLLFFYGRLPFLETGLICLSGLLFYLFIRHHSSWWGQLLIGIVVAVTGLAGKLFGFVLLGPVLVGLWYLYGKEAIKPVGLVLAGTVIGSLLYVVLFFGGDYALLLRYYGEQTTGMYGEPPGFSSVPNFFKMLFTYGGESGFYKFTPVFLIVTWVSVLLVLLTIPAKKDDRRKFLPVLFLLGWLFFGIIGLSPFYYRPIRYSLFLLLPSAGIIGYAFMLVRDRSVRAKLQPMIPTVIGLLLVNWYYLTQICMLFGKKGHKQQFGIDMMPISFMIALAVTGVLFLLIRNGQRKMPSKTIATVLLALVVIAVGNQGRYLVTGMTNRTDFIYAISRQLPDYISESAVLTGPFGATFTINNELHNVIYMFGLSNKDKSLFHKFPITHVATDVSNWKQAVADYPELQQARRVLQLPVRNMAIVVYRLDGAASPLTDYERGSMLLGDGQVDSAKVYFDRFYSKYPDHTLGLTVIPFCLLNQNKLAEAEVSMQKIIHTVPANYVLDNFAAGFYRELYRRTEDTKYREKYQYYEEAIKDLGE